MKVIILSESGYNEALFGIGLSYGKTSGMSFDDFKADSDLKQKMQDVAMKLKDMAGGENKFLRQISVKLDVTAPRMWWTQFDTYKIGTTAQSESTMHSLMHKKLSLKDFDIEFMNNGGKELLIECISHLNILIKAYKIAEDSDEKKIIWYDIISLLPQSFMQRRIVSLNYAVLQNIINHRSRHKLCYWHVFCHEILKQVEYPSLLQ